MKKITLAMAACLLAAAALAEDAAKAPAKKMAGHHHMAPKPVAMMPSDLKWADVPGAPGVQAADMWGNHDKGAFGGFFKFAAGFASPLHTHTNEMKIVVISGTFLQTPEGGQEMRLGAGSYLKQPGDGYRHTTGCDKASDCVIFASSTGKFDFKPVGEAKAPEKK